MSPATLHVPLKIPVWTTNMIPVFLKKQGKRAGFWGVFFKTVKIHSENYK